MSKPNDSTVPLFVNWCPRDVLDDMALLLPMEELAYRRVIDLIYLTGDTLPDDDRRMGNLTRVGAKWRKIKEVLLRLGKIEIVEGRITNTRCRGEIEAAVDRIGKASTAGKLSAEARKGKLRSELGPQLGPQLEAN